MASKRKGDADHDANENETVKRSRTQFLAAKTTETIQTHAKQTQTQTQAQSVSVFDHTQHAQQHTLALKLADSAVNRCFLLCFRVLFGFLLLLLFVCSLCLSVAHFRFVVKANKQVFRTRGLAHFVYVCCACCLLLYYVLLLWLSLLFFVVTVVVVFVSLFVADICEREKSIS